MIAKCFKPPKDNEKRRRQIRFNEKGNCARDNGENNDDHKIYTSMTRMSSNDERSLLFLIISWWLGKFCDHVIFRSTSKAFPRRTFHLSIGGNINRASFLLFLSYPFEAIFHRMIVTSIKCALCLDRM